MDNKQMSMAILSSDVMWQPEDTPESVGQASVEYKDTNQILTKGSGFMDSYDYTLNPYYGCTFGCTYCYAAFFASAGDLQDNWGYWVRAKQNAIEIMNRPRQRAKLDGASVYMSSATDPYQPIERKLNLTRGILEIMTHHTPDLVVQTRSPDVLRDTDLFKKIEYNGGKVRVNMTVTTDNEGVRKVFEPYCPSGKSRLDAIREVREQGIKTSVTITPFLWADDIDQMISDVIETGADRVLMAQFKFTKGNFVANTRNEALELMADLLGCKQTNVQVEYQKHYEEARSVVMPRVQQEGIYFGENKDGFAKR